MAILNKDKKPKATISEQKYFVRIFDDLEGELVDPIEFMAVRKKFGNTFFLINEAFTNTSIKEIPDFDKVLWPTLKGLEYEDQYKNLSEVQNQIKTVREVLESGEVPEKDQSEKNILDYKRELYYLTLLETKFQYPKARFIQRTKDGTPVLTYVRKGNVPLSLGYDINARIIYVPTDQHIQTHGTRKTEVDFNFPLKKPSKFNFKNAVALFMLLLCAFFIYGIYDNKQTAQDIQTPLIQCQESLRSLNVKQANDLTNIAKEVGDIAKTVQNTAKTTQSQQSTPPNAR